MTHARPLPPRSCLALALAATLLAGCTPPDAAQAPRLLTPAELAAFAAQAEGAPPDDGLANRAEALRARAAALRAGAAARDDTQGEALRRRAAELRTGS